MITTSYFIIYKKKVIQTYCKGIDYDIGVNFIRKYLAIGNDELKIKVSTINNIKKSNKELIEILGKIM